MREETAQRLADDNLRRATRAQHALDFYAESYGEQVDADSSVDLLSDLMHLLGGFEFAERARAAKDHYEAEQRAAKNRRGSAK